jgi:hypothetical protein
MEKNRIIKVHTEKKRKRFREIYTDGEKEGQRKRHREAGTTLRG